MTSPLIGITCNVLSQIPQTVSAGIAAPEQDWQLLAADYIRMIEKAGGVPLILPVTKELSKARSIWERLDGILISGGNDVDPRLYGERISARCGFLDDVRDAYELAAVRFAREHRIPLLGICRGIQIFNVAAGGSLYQDLPSVGFPLHTIMAKKRNEGTHTVRLEEDGLLARLLGKKEIWVNSFHHQAVRQPGKEITVLAESEEGVIEAVALGRESFAVAVQWHPEMMFDDADQLKIAGAFVAACAGKQEGRVCSQTAGRRSQAANRKSRLAAGG